MGCFLVRHGMGGDDALAEIKRLRQNVANNWMQSPETDEQVRFVKNWMLGDKTYLLSYIDLSVGLG